MSLSSTSNNSELIFVVTKLNYLFKFEFSELSVFQCEVISLTSEQEPLSEQLGTLLSPRSFNSEPIFVAPNFTLFRNVEFRELPLLK